jgi:hypothetical protein
MLVVAVLFGYCLRQVAKENQIWRGDFEHSNE